MKRLAEAILPLTPANRMSLRNGAEPSSSSNSRHPPLIYAHRPAETACEASENLGNGAQGRNRTADTVIFSHVLYQLSYLGPPGGASRPAWPRRATRLPNCHLSSLSTPSGVAPGGARQCDSPRRAISRGRGPCSRGSRTARASSAAGLPHSGHFLVLAGSAWPPDMASEASAAQGDGAADLARQSRRASPARARGRR